MTELKLCLYIEDNIEKTVTVHQDEFILGRLPDCDLYLPYIGISRHQARIFKTAGCQWFIEDMGSKNGTLLNGEFITEPHRLNQDDMIGIGTISLRVFLVNCNTVTQNNTDIQSEEITIIRNVQYLQQQWIPSERQGDTTISQELAIVRLKDLLEIARKLNSAESIEAIFQAAQAVVFRYIQSIERLALLIDVSGTGKLSLFNAAGRDIADHKSLKDNPSWISRTICYKVFAEKIALQTSDAQRDERFNNEQSIIDKGIHKVMAVPLWDENNVVGVLYADSYNKFNNSIHESEEDISFFSTLANLVAASVQRWLLTRKLRTEEISRQRLERYLSPAVVQQTMMAGTLENGRLAPQESEISILFADIVGFTALSERLTPAQIAELLNSFFEEMLQEIFAANGTLDKFIGDCIMAFFGAPEPQEDHAERALNVAKAMLERLENLNNHQVLSEPLQLRIAINSGKAVVGDVGSSQRVDYTVLGTTINLASRIQSVCLPGRCVISENTYNLLRPSQRLLLDDIGERRFKGIERPVRIYQTMKRGILD
ncbi:MAG TPA: adenylate cyclase [Cyanobacteria bacterium UBA11372]|nr:adenylate cyclase [Cyanobacteria bacterium UBA11372]